MNKLILSLFLVVGVLTSAQIKKISKKSTKQKKVLIQKPAHKVPIVQDSSAVIPVVETATEKEAILQEKPEIQEEEVYIPLVKKLEKSKGWIGNRNSYTNGGVWAYLKGVWFGKEKFFVMVDLQNKTNIPYNIRNISFETTYEGQVLNAETQKLAGEVSTVWKTDFSSLQGKSSQKLIFVLDKFPIYNGMILQMSITENDAQRTINIPISEKYIKQARYIN